MSDRYPSAISNLGHHQTWSVLIKLLHTNRHCAEVGIVGIVGIVSMDTPDMDMEDVVVPTKYSKY